MDLPASYHYSDPDERLCRIMCIADGVDPDKESIGIGVYIPKGQPFKLWEARRNIARAIRAAGYSGPAHA